MLEIFQTLGIAPTKDERQIKNAYREKLSVTNPEDDPEGFKRLRNAFEAANRYAAQSEEEKVKERDTTPSGLWIEKAEELYKRLSTRCETTTWEKLFSEDIFISLEEEENCRTKFMVFLMDHFRFPTEIWQLFDKKLKIVEGASKLRESFPADFIGFIANKCEREEDIDFKDFRGEDDAPYDLFLRYYEQASHAIENDELEQAQEFIKNAEELGITHPIMEVCKARILKKKDDIQGATDVLEKVWKEYPENSAVAYNMAEFLWNNNNKDRAADIYQSIKKRLDTHYMANVRLTEWYYNKGEYKTAKTCAEKVLSIGADDDFMDILHGINGELEKELEKKFHLKGSGEDGLELGWCYLQDGKLYEGVCLTKKLEGKIPEEKDAEYRGLKVKLAIEFADYEDAIVLAEEWEKALEQKMLNDKTEEERNKDQDRIRQSHLIRMEAYRMIAHGTDIIKEGKSREYFEKAISESEVIETGTMKDISMLMEKAQILMEMEEYERSIEVTRYLIERFTIYAAFATEIEIHRRQWNAGGVIGAARQCINIFPDYIRAYEHAAKVYLDLGKMEDLQQILDEAKNNHVESVILDAFRYQMTHKVPETEELNNRVKEFRSHYLRNLDEGKLSYYEEGLPIITEYLYWYPGTYMLVERGLFHRAAHKLAEAEEDFGKALAENPYHPYALNNLSITYRYQQKYDKALVCVKKAIRFADENMGPGIYADMSHIYSLLGDNEKALEIYLYYLEHCEESQKRSALIRIATLYGRCDKLPEAERALQKAYNGRTHTYYREIVDIMQQSGRFAQAMDYLKEWDKTIGAEQSKLIQRLKPKKEVTPNMLIEYYQRKAWQYLLSGEQKKAIVYFEKMYRMNTVSPNEGKICDALFGCILCDDEKWGRKYAAILQDWMKKQKESSVSQYYDRQKAYLQIRFLAGYYTMSDQQLEEILAAEKQLEICYFCDYAVCKELEGVRILFLLKQGKNEEARERLRRNLQKQPHDEYMLAIRHRLEMEK